MPNLKDTPKHLGMLQESGKLKIPLIYYYLMFETEENQTPHNTINDLMFKPKQVKSIHA